MIIALNLDLIGQVSSKSKSNHFIVQITPQNIQVLAGSTQLVRKKDLTFDVIRKRLTGNQVFPLNGSFLFIVTESNYDRY
jgi:hypothetical protein